MTGNLPQNFNGYFKEMRNQHNYNTRGSKERIIFKIPQRTTTHGLNSIYHRGANDCNELLKNIGLESDKYFFFKTEICLSTKSISVK